MTDVSAGAFGEWVEEVMEDPNIPRGLREYLIAVAHELRMKQIEGRSRAKKRTGQDIGVKGSSVWRDAAWLLNPKLDENGAWLLAKGIIGDDAPRYEMTWPGYGERTCVGSMLRPLGAPCRKRATRSSSIPNPMNGELRWAGACSNRAHVAVYEAQHRDGWAAWRINGSPKPSNNVGGQMMRFLTYEKWDELYAWANHRYTPGATPEPEKPRARLGIVTPFRLHEKA